LTRPFKIGPKLFVLSFCQFSRNSFSPLSIQVVDILPIDLFAFLCRRIGACDVENPVLHEVVIRVAAVWLSPARKPDVAVRHQSADSVIRGEGGLNLFDALFEILGKLRLRPAETQPHDDERKQSSDRP
jgi:hypothetical protein